MKEYLREKFNFRNGSFLLITLLLCCAFVASVLLFAYDFTQLSDEGFKKHFWDNIQLHTDKDSFLSRPWTVSTYSFFDKKLLSVFASIFWIAILGFRIDTTESPFASLRLFVTSTLLAGLVMILSGILLGEELLVYGARVPLLGFAVYLVLRKNSVFISIYQLKIPIVYFAGFYILLSVLDIFMQGSITLALGYLGSALTASLNLRHEKRHQ